MAIFHALYNKRSQFANMCTDESVSKKSFKSLFCCSFLNFAVPHEADFNVIHLRFIGTLLLRVNVVAAR